LYSQIEEYASECGFGLVIGPIVVIIKRIGYENLPGAVVFRSKEISCIESNRKVFEGFTKSCINLLRSTVSFIKA
jgi:hypothetical protein